MDFPSAAPKGPPSNPPPIVPIAPTKPLWRPACADWPAPHIAASWAAAVLGAGLPREAVEGEALSTQVGLTFPLQVVVVMEIVAVLHLSLTMIPAR